MVILVWGPAKWWYGCLVTGVGFAFCRNQGNNGIEDSWPPGWRGVAVVRAGD